MCDNALTLQYLMGRDKAGLPVEADKERVDIYGQPDSSVLQKSILQKTKQAQNLQLDPPGHSLC